MFDKVCLDSLVHHAGNLTTEDVIYGRCPFCSTEEEAHHIQWDGVVDFTGIEQDHRPYLHFTCDHCAVLLTLRWPTHQYDKKRGVFQAEVTIGRVEGKSEENSEALA